MTRAQILLLRQSWKRQISKLRRSKNEVKSLKNNFEIDKLLRDISEIAYLTPGSDGYSTIKYDLGVLTVQLADVQPYANGAKITLNFGNTLSASVNGLKMTMDWGKVDKEGKVINESSKSKEVVLSELLRSGAWMKFSVVLDGIPPSELGFVRVHNVTHTGIRLFK